MKTTVLHYNLSRHTRLPIGIWKQLCIFTVHCSPTTIFSLLLQYTFDGFPVNVYRVQFPVIPNWLIMRVFFTLKHTSYLSSMRSKTTADKELWSRRCVILRFVDLRVYLNSCVFYYRNVQKYASKLTIFNSHSIKIVTIYIYIYIMYKKIKSVSQTFAIIVNISNSHSCTCYTCIDDKTCLQGNYRCNS